jgi:transposase-like protein
MRDDDIEGQGEELREALALERLEAGGPGRWRCSERLRARVVAYAVGCLADGESQTRIAARLGIQQSKLSRWLREAGTGTDAGFRQVAIVPSERRTPRPLPAPLRLVTPRGFIVEGLDAELLAVLLRVLG